MHKISIKEFPDLDLGDKRRGQRLISIINNISSKPGSTIPHQNESWYDTKATYNFFSNEEISIEKLKTIIGEYGYAQLNAMKEVLIPHDKTNINFSGLEQTEGLGYLDHKHSRGIMCFNSIAVSSDGLPLSVLHQHSWARPLEDLAKNLKKTKGKRRFEDKETYHWYEGIIAVNKLLGGNIRKIHIADREADVYDLFFCGFEENTELLIRCCHNRKLGDGTVLWESLAEMPVMGKADVQIIDKNGKHNKVNLAIRYKLVEILRPTNNKNAYDSVELTIIEARQVGKVDNEEERICWRLLTTIDVDNIVDAMKCVRWYTYRWLIERFHYALKQGTRIEQLQLKDVRSLQKALAVYSIAAFKIMQLTYQSRSTPQASCEVALSQTEWMVLHMLIHKTNKAPKTVPSLHNAVQWIGKLGGHLGRTSDGPPGLKTVWRGYEELSNATKVYEIMNYDKRNERKIKQKNLGKG
jgi:hypothetical protein